MTRVFVVSIVVPVSRGLGLAGRQGFPKFSEVEGVLGVFVVGLHYVRCLATSGVDLEDAI